MFLVWGMCAAQALPMFTSSNGDIPAGPLMLTGLGWGKQSCSHPSLSQYHCEMPGQLLEDDSGVDGEGMVLHRYLGCREVSCQLIMGQNKSFMVSMASICALVREGPLGPELEGSVVCLHECFLCANLAQGQG